LSDEEIKSDVDERNEKNLRTRFLIDDITIFLFSLVHFVIFIAINITLINEFVIIRARNASRERRVNSADRFRSLTSFARDDSDSSLDTNLDRCDVMSLFFEHFE
jgi:hypothetical protein